MITYKIQQHNKLRKKNWKLHKSLIQKYWIHAARTYIAYAIWHFFYFRLAASELKGAHCDKQLLLKVKKQRKVKSVFQNMWREQNRF